MGHTPLPSRPSTPSVVHPHARGAYQLKWRFWTPYNGSSPPTWGIRCSTAPTIDISRFIPTYVGHTLCHAEQLPQLSGSSPHTWGILTDNQADMLIARFIPTYVGHTALTVQSRKHLRGSSPHTWGIRSGGPGRCRGRAVHPHIRGAYWIGGLVGALDEGSSPHTWGIRPRQSNWERQSRFIPTYVGHTDFPVRASLFPPVHPHIRGAYGITGHYPVMPFRFIPTYVGHTAHARTRARH